MSGYDAYTAPLTSYAAGHPVPFVLETIVVGFVLSAATCALLLPLLRSLRVRQQAYEYAPQTHQQKTGTPTMGGVCFVVALLPLLLPEVRNGGLGTFFLFVAACAAVGFIDDILAVKMGRNRGLRARTKFLLTALIAVMFLRAIPNNSIFHLPGYDLVVPYWLWLTLGIVAITGTIHSVNLTDGLDGLASGVVIFPLAALAAQALVFFDARGIHISVTGGPGAASIPALLGIGACVAFLLFNRYPAKLIMGDTGSLALGALLSGVAITSGEMLLLVVIGFVFVAEALSVMLQVVYFKLTHGKRIFKMSPLHHHFELSGWPEMKVTTRFWIASALCSAVGLAIVR